MLLTEGEIIGITLGILALIVAMGAIVVAWVLYKKASRETNKKFENQESQINLLARKLSDLEPHNAEMVKDAATGNYTHLAKSRGMTESVEVSEAVMAVVRRAPVQNLKQDDAQDDTTR